MLLEAICTREAGDAGSNDNSVIVSVMASVADGGLAVVRHTCGYTPQ